MMYRWFWGPTVGLHDCLAAFFSADELKGDNMYRYEKIAYDLNSFILSYLLIILAVKNVKSYVMV